MRGSGLMRQNLVRITSAPLPHSEPGDRPVASEIQGPQRDQFDREAFKQAAVMELRSTLAKIHVSSRDWLAQQSSGGSQKVDSDPAAPAAAREELARGSTVTRAFKERSETGSDSQPAKPEGETPVVEKTGKLNPLIAYLHQLREQQRNSRYVQTRRVKPKYPRRALERGIEGEVVVSFNIDPAGRVTNPEIIQASPAGVFEGQVLRAMEQFEYQTIVVDGRPARVEGATEVFRFVLKS